MLGALLLLVCLGTTYQQTSINLVPEEACQCAGGNCQLPLQNVAGLCGYLDDTNQPLNGCCDATSAPDPPFAAPGSSCSASCLSLFYSYWCSIGCADRQPGLTLCQTEVQELYNACRTCPTFGTYATFSAYTTALTNAGVTVSDASSCFNFKAPIRFPAEGTAPILSPITPAPSPDFQVAATQTVTAAMNIEQPMNGGISNPPTSATVAFIDPNGKRAAEKHFGPKDFMNSGTGVYSIQHSIELGWKALVGNWRLSVLLLSNTFASVSSANNTGQFTVTSTFGNPVNLGDVDLCSADRVTNSVNAIGSSTVLLGEDKIIENLRCCDPTSCTVECSTTTTGTNSINGVTSEQGSDVLTLDQCRDVRAAATWTLPATLDLRGSTITWLNGVLRADAATVTFSGAAPSRVFWNGSSTFQSNAQSLSNGVDSIVSLGARIAIPEQGQPDANPYAYTVADNAHMVILGRVLLSKSQSSFIVNSGSSQRETVLVSGDGNTGSADGSIACSNTNAKVRVIRGRIEVHDGGHIDCNVELGGTLNTPRKYKPTQALSKPRDFNGEVCCGSVCGLDVTVQNLAALFIYPAGNNVDTPCRIPNGQFSAIVQNRLRMSAGSRLIIGPVIQNMPLFSVGIMDLQGTIDLEIVFGTIGDPKEHTIDIIRYANNANSGSCPLTTTPIYVNEPSSRNVTSQCRTENGAHILSVRIPAVSSTNPVGTTTPTFASVSTYTILFQQKLQSFPTSSFLAAIQDANGVSPDVIEIVSYIDRGSVIQADFRCTSGQSAQAADAVCSGIVGDANSPGTALNTRLNAQSTSQSSNNAEEDDGSNNGSYALFILLLIPCCIIIAVVMFLHFKRSKADNQYMQDTAVFSNVAASPQPINYPYPQPDPYNAYDTERGGYSGRRPSPVYVNEDPYLMDASPHPNAYNSFRAPPDDPVAYY